MGNKLSKVLGNPFCLYEHFANRAVFRLIPDWLHLRLMFRGTVGVWPDLDDPKTYNEKLQWLKIHDRNPLYNKLVDKFRVKQWVAGRIGGEHVAKTYAKWDNAEDIDISNLPDQFVLKTNHDCGGVAICRNRAEFDLEAAQKKLSSHLKINYYWRTREWPYKDVEPCVFAEEYLDSGATGDIPDYKVSCFGGVPRLIEVHLGRSAEHTCDYFTPNWDPLPEIEWADIPKSKNAIEKPSCLDEMLRLSSLLTKGFPQARADWYILGDRLLFGELTFFSDAGFGRMDEHTATMLGSWIDLGLAYDNR